MTHTPTPAEIETLRRAREGCSPGTIASTVEVLAKIALADIDRLSPPAPEVDEATMWTRKVMDANWSYWGSNAEMRSEIIRQAIAELIASKDAEIAEWRNNANAAHRQLGNVTAKFQKAEAELAALRAENERLRNFCTLEQCEEAAERKAAEPAAEIEAACDKMAARMGAKFEKNERWPEVAAVTDTAPVVEVTEAKVLPPLILSFSDAEIYREHVAEAEARGRRDALKNLDWLRIASEAREADSAYAAAEKLERMMTEGK